jgi:TetR/AcrR family transcriptional regulator, transcriptional repressor for nem operon
MPRRSAEEKAHTHEQILERASRAFRTHGSGVGIGEVMKDLGLTTGGFYRHFDSKDDLFVKAVSASLIEIAERLERVAMKAPRGQELAAVITAYLSEEHLRHPETWCALATLAPDVGRLPSATRRQLDAALQTYQRKLSRFMPGEDDTQRGAHFLVLFSGMAGAIAMLRVLADKGMREQALAMTRDHYLKTFAGSGW